jgi:glycosyltransferase involved in cell wall biosynthesis
MNGKGLRFAVITTFYPPYHFGGDAYAVRRLVHALANRGHRVEVIHDADAYYALNPDADPRPLDEPKGVQVHTLRSKAGRWSCLATHQLGRPVVHGRQIADILRTGFDVIHFHNISLVGGPGILAYGDAIKLYTAHEHWLVCPTHVLWRHNREVCDSRQCFRCVLSYRRPPQLWRAGSLLERNARHVDAFLSLSRFSANKHKEFGFASPMRVVPPFLPDAERATPVAPATEDLTARPYFLFVGRLERIKGLQDAIPLFRGEGPADLLIAGTGNFEPELRALGVNAPRVRFLGQQPAERLRTLYRNAIGTLMPSTCYEVFPMVALESFREGTPLIARRLGPFPDIIADSGGGLLFDNESSLRDAIARLTGDKALRNELGAAAAAAYETRWSEKVAMGEYFSLIQDLAEKRGMPELVARLSANSVAPRPAMAAGAAL